MAVKEYSRSSADQAEPLAHELRPLPVLQMTTDYLMSTIVDRCDRPGENLADWFNFLWDRTRGIRKVCKGILLTVSGFQRLIFLKLDNFYTFGLSHY